MEVKSVEEFQGQERKVVIISTVRSQQKFVSSDYQFGLGFLRNPKVSIYNFIYFYVHLGVHCEGRIGSSEINCY